MKFKTKYNYILYLSSWAINIFLLVLVFASIDKDGLDMFYSSDTLYLASLYKDIFVDGTGLAGWHLNAAPNFFPDMFLYFIINSIFSNFRLSYLIFSSIQYLLILGLLNLLLINIKPTINNIFITFLNLIFPVFLLTTITSGLSTYNYLILSHSFHNGMFINILIASIILFRYLQTKKKLFLYFAAIITLIGVYNDRLFLIMYSAPIIIVYIFNYIWFKNKQIKAIAPIIIIASALSILLYNLTSSNSVFSCIDLGKKYMNFENTLSSFITFLKEHFSYIIDLKIKSIISSISILNFFVLLFLIFKKSRNKQSIDSVFYVFIFVSIFLTLIAPIINGYYMNEATARFHIFSFWLSVFNLSLFFNILFKNKLKYIYITIIVLFAFYTALIIVKFTQIPIAEKITSIVNYYPEEVKVIDKFAKKNDLKYGLAEYWDAKYTTLFSQEEIRVYTIIDEKLNPWFHVMNKNWYFDYHKGKYNKPVFKFIILNGLNKEKIKKNFGKPLDSLIFNKETILYLMEDIKFNRADNKAYLVNDLQK